MFIDEDILRDVDSELESFFNVNTKEDFSALLEKLKMLQVKNNHELKTKTLV
ncbi:MAG: hypothetical protein RXR51_04715 [Nitrososphaeria archaeon]